MYIFYLILGTVIILNLYFTYSQYLENYLWPNYSPDKVSKL